MELELTHLNYQEDCIESICKVLENVEIKKDNPAYQNPIIDIKDKEIEKNINEIWKGYTYYNDRIEEVRNIEPIVEEKRTIDKHSSLEGILEIDAKLETGTGKTYIYTKLMYELNERYGFNKFIIFVPSVAIREGTKNFIKSSYSRRHFLDDYPNIYMNLDILESMQTLGRGRNSFPNEILSFIDAKRINSTKKQINVLMMSGQMLGSKNMSRDNYENSMYTRSTMPSDALKETRPIIIIDEPHRFNKNRAHYKNILEKLNPQCIIRFGATFPKLRGSKVTDDYSNLVYELNSIKAFNKNLIKGIAVETLGEVSEGDVPIKLMSVKAGGSRSCRIRAEKTKQIYELYEGDSLSRIDNSFEDIYVSGIGAQGGALDSKSIVLSNDRELSESDIFYSSVLSSTFQEMMIESAIDLHFNKEKENFFREGGKIKTLSLFFIDNIESYRGKDEKGYLRNYFEKTLKSRLTTEINKIDRELEVSSSKVKLEYRNYLKSSLNNIQGTHGGYFAEDKADKEEAIQIQYETILSDKEKLLSFEDSEDNHNIMRFIFSKWTLREGWDNPNVFLITKLRSSGSEISKLQEIGRGLRLPVDEYGNRITDEHFILDYLVDYSEKDFVRMLKGEIEKDIPEQIKIKKYLNELAELLNYESGETLFAELLLKKFIDIEGIVIKENIDNFVKEYPIFNDYLNINIKDGKVIDRNKKETEYINIRENKFLEIKDFWFDLNVKYGINLYGFTEDVLKDMVFKILNMDIDKTKYVDRSREEFDFEDNKILIKESVTGSYKFTDILSYGEFLKKINSSTNLPLYLINECLKEYNKTKKLSKEFFNHETTNNFTKEFKKLYQKLVEEGSDVGYEYQKINSNVKLTALTDENGEPKEKIISGRIGDTVSDDSPETFIYDKIVYDSGIELQNIERSESLGEDIIAFAKLPTSSIKIPLYFGGTTSPDFMYLIKDNIDKKEKIRLVIESKGYEEESSERKIERYKINAIEKFFKTLEMDGMDIKFVYQKEDDHIKRIIDSLKE